MGDYIKENGTFDLLRKLNLDKVYKTILLNSFISKTEIAEKTDLNLVTVSNCANILIDRGVIEKIGVASSNGGRPREMLALKKTFGIFISVEVDYIAGRILVMDLQGQIFERGVLPEVQKNPHKFLDFLVEKVEWYKKNYSYMEFGVAGLSVILPANYNKNTGYVEYIQSMQEWNGFNISAALKERIPDVLSFVMPACQAAALGEIHFGASNPLRYMACILGVLGITMSIYSQGSFFSGKDGFAGRLGHTIVEKNGRQCVCGNKGCLEMYSALRPILDKMGLYKERGYENIRMLMELKKKNDPQLLEVLKEASEYMAITIVNIANMYNVEEVCISGYLGTLLEGDMLNKIRKDVEGMLKEHYKKGFKVYCSKLGSFACVYGGIALIRDELVEVITSRAKNNTAEN